MTLRAGTVLDVVVAGAGAAGNGIPAVTPGQYGSFWYGGGGGGGSFVFAKSAARPLFVAGGGGGASTQFFGSGPGGAGQAGSAGEKGLGGVYNPTQGPASLSGYGGVNGGGGKVGHSGNTQQPGGGGAGWSGNGGGYAEPIYVKSLHASEYVYQGGVGGSSRPSFAGGQSGFSHTHSYVAYGYAGGFGGGGGGGYLGGGGGGGGFSGGGGGGQQGNKTRFYGGGGGGSYVSAQATDITDIGGVNSGNGLVTITELAAVPEPKAWSLMFTGLGFVGYVLRRRLTSRLRRA